jgi:hypothetical protein
MSADRVVRLKQETNDKPLHECGVLSCMQRLISVSLRCKLSAPACLPACEHHS